MAGLAIAVLLAAPVALVVTVIAPSGAQAAGQSITIVPAGPYKGGEKVTVTASGFSPNAPIAVGLCKKGRVATGPGDCAASKTGASRLIQANAQGVGTGAITIVLGSIGNSKPPADSCGPKNPCVMGAANITNAKEAVNKDIAFVGATTSTPKPSTSASAEPSASATPKPTLTEIPKQGPREDALKFGFAGVIALQLGLIAVVRANRAAPRRFRSH